MGSIVYDFLTESFLFDDDSLSNNFNSFTEIEIKKELSRYREFILKNINTIEKEIYDYKSELKVLAGIKKMHLDNLKRAAFYIDQHIIYDPLFPYTHEESESSKAFMEYHKAENKFDIVGLVNTLKYLKSISYLVACDYVKILPISYLHEPADEIPMLYSENLFSDVLPKNVLKYFHENVKVQSMKINGNILAVENKLYPCRSIFISFPKEELDYTRFYSLFESEVIKVEEETRTVHSIQHLPETPPDAEQFELWVMQSINQAAKNVFDEIYLENIIAAKYDASYMASNKFAFNLMQQSIETKQNIKTNSANLLMNFDLPFFDNIDINTVLEIRKNDGEAFKNFRTNIDRHFKELRGIEDVSLLEKKFENAIHEITEVQINDVNQKFNQLKKHIKIDSSILIGGLLGTIQTSGMSLIGSAIAVAKGYKDWNDYFEKVKNHPAYFLWKVKKKSNAL